MYTPYIYTKKEKVDKNKIDEMMFKYYVINCGEEEVEKDCRII